MNKRACIHSTPIELRKRVVHKNLSNLIKNVTGSVKLHFSFACILVCLKKRDTHFYFIVFFSHIVQTRWKSTKKEKKIRKKKRSHYFPFLCQRKREMDTKTETLVGEICAISSFNLANLSLCPSFKPGDGFDGLFVIWLVIRLFTQTSKSKYTKFKYVAPKTE